MRKSLLMLLIVILVFSSVIGPYEIMQASLEAESTSGEPWPMFRHNPERTGFSSSSAPVDNKTTTLLWSNTTSAMIEYSSPAVFGNWLFIGTLSGSLCALNSTSGHLKWSKMLGGRLESSPAVGNGRVFVGSTNGTFYALNMTTGGILWKSTIGDEVYSSPAIMNGKVYIASLNRTVYALHETNGTVIWKRSNATSYIKSSPAVSDGRLFVGSSDRRIYVYGAENGALEQTFDPLGGQIEESSPCISNGKIFVGVTNEKALYALNQSSGSVIWKKLLGDHIRSSPAVAYGKVFVGSEDSKMYAFEESTGTQTWNFSSGGPLVSSPAVANGAVFIGSRDKKIYALNASTGQKIWSYQTNDEIWSSPAVANGVVFVGSKDTNVYAFSENTPPTAHFNPPDPPFPHPNQTVTFDASTSFDADLDPIVDYKWDFGDGNTTSTDQPIIYHKYLQGGTYDVKLIVKDSHGAESAPYTDSVPVRKHEWLIVEVSPQEANVTKGQTLNISITVRNNGDYDENITVTAWCANSTHRIPVSDAKNILLLISETRILSFPWNTVNFTRGTYSISATADGKEKDDGNVEILVHDMALRVIDVGGSDEVIVNQTVPISMAVFNEGDFTEHNVNVTLYANQTLIGTNHTDIIVKGSYWYSILEWDTTGFSLGNYKIWGNVTVVPDDVDTDNNYLTDGTMQVRSLFHDVATIDVIPFGYNATQGEILNVTVSLKNQGEYQSENATVTLWYSNATVPESLDSTNISVERDAIENVTLRWNTADFSGGDYEIGAYVVIKDLEKDVNNNNKTDGIVHILIPVHDVQVEAINPKKTTAFKGRPMPIDVVFENRGNFSMPSFTAYLYQNESFYQSQSIPALSAGERGIWRLSWGPPEIGNYMIKAHASINDGNLTNNNMTIKISVDKAVSDIAANWVGLTPYLDQIPSGRQVTVTTEVENKGAWDEIFTLRAFANQTSNANITLISQAQVQLTYLSDPKNVSFVWNTGLFMPATYRVFANVTVLPDEDKILDNCYQDGTVLIVPGFHNVGVSGSILPEPLEKTLLCLSRRPNLELTMNISATVYNSGSYVENVPVIAYLVNSTHQTLPVGCTNVTNLLPMETRQVIIQIRVWNDSGIQKDSYWPKVRVEITDDAIPSDDEKTYLFILIRVSMTGDIASDKGLGTPDGKVDMKDIAQASKRFGTRKGQTDYHAVCDIVFDGKIDIKDIAILAKEFGKIDP